MGASEELLESTKNWRDIVQLNARTDSLNAFVDAIVSSSSEVDKISSWTLGAGGAIAGLIIANIDKLGAKHFDIADIKVMLLILTSSILCGLAQKSLALKCAVHVQVKGVLSLKLKEIMTVFELYEEKIEQQINKHKLDLTIDFNLQEVITRFVELSPFYIKWLVKKQTSKTIADPEYGPRLILKIYYRQNLWFVLQAIAFIGFILFTVLSL
ncbi:MULTISPECIES: hypothetical protein [unclassified Pseudoalteromonas]|uniref:hypothetical protein n=1 Tax=unclassified Pseudoalteromonas TaxID=194690 RepID=UPI0015FBEF3E|nr:MULTISPECIES: hypothetical protein [unclassified Pseudoalteromonas]MBB1331149.1 hypothetical protein [Pseudoalteromonas sp. SR43-7]MBB1336854.1 hypothetical protein [Pseudoalteromonas sp. SR44-2]|tara:strand:- start:261 stop:896 length:636 start_codon:yes stop_codon:yes gene_type:complete